MDIKYCIDKEPDYENFKAICPYCGYNNIFNRVTDLGTINLISFKEVECMSDECMKKFNINGDLANSRHQHLIFGCYSLKDQKKNMYCILNLAQACEVFFSKFIKIKFAEFPLKERCIATNEANEILHILYKSMPQLGFVDLRNIFIRLVCEDKNYDLYEGIKSEIETIKKLQFRNALKKCESEFDKVLAKGWKKDFDTIMLQTKKWCTIKDAELKKLKNKKLSNYLIKLKYLKINEIRNKVVHDSAYRPSLQEVDEHLSKVRDVVLNLDSILKINSLALISLST